MQSGLQDWIPKQHRAEIKRQLKQEWDHRCAYCGIKEKHKELTIDHVTPLAKQGTDDFSNLVPCCRQCNISKADKPIRQWYFDSEDFTNERWSKIKQHITKQEHVLAS